MSPQQPGNPDNTTSGGQSFLDYLFKPDRDFEKGDKGDDVAKLQRLLSFFGMKVDDNEVKQKTFGDSTAAASETLAEKTQNNPLLALVFNFLAQYVLHVDPQEFRHPEESVGTQAPVRHYQDFNKGNMSNLDALEAGAQSQGGSGPEKLQSLANKMVGVRGTEDVVKHFCGGQDVYWCGGFAKHMFDATMPGVYSQDNALAAISFKEEAEKYGAFRRAGSGYTPQVGDAVVFSRKGGNHVGVVTKVENGRVTYVSGNSNNSVRSTSFDIDAPPPTLRGYSDTHALADAKGIAIGAGQEPSLAHQQGHNTRKNPVATRA